MPHNLFEYHTMGLSPVGPEEAGGGLINSRGPIDPMTGLPYPVINPPSNPTPCPAVACPLGTSQNAKCQCAYPDGSLYQQPTPITPAGPDESCRFSGTTSKCASYWLANKCVVNYSDGQGITSIQCPPKNPNPPPTGGTGPLCNPSSVGKRFSFNFPSGKKWTLSKSDDAQARAFYCGSGGGGGGGGTGGTGPIMDIAYCTGGEGAYDGKPTFWTSSARKGCKTNNQGQSMPYGREISKEEYDLAGRVLCNDGTYQSPGGFFDACHNHGGYPGDVINPPTGGTGPNCPPQNSNKMLISQARIQGMTDGMQGQYGSMSNNFKTVFGIYEKCPIYGELMSAYMAGRASAPVTTPIYQSR